MMKCDWCGKEFPADARACVEAGFDAVHDPEDMKGEEWKGKHTPSLAPDHFTPAQREQMKEQMGLDEAQLDELLRTGKVHGLGAIVCLECQDDCVPDPDDDGDDDFSDCGLMPDGKGHTCTRVGSEECEFCPHRHLLG
jgi:hypothetical protein